MSWAMEPVWDDRSRGLRLEEYLAHASATGWQVQRVGMFNATLASQEPPLGAAGHVLWGVATLIGLLAFILPGIVLAIVWAVAATRSKPKYVPITVDEAGRVWMHRQGDAQPTQVW